jgi:hypothetical protein
MREELIVTKTFELAKEKGFNIHVCRCGGYPECICVDRLPSQSLLARWIREMHSIHIEIYCNASGWGYILTKLNGTTIQEIMDDVFFKSNEEALEVGLVEALKRIRND